MGYVIVTDLLPLGIGAEYPHCRQWINGSVNTTKTTSISGVYENAATAITYPLSFTKILCNVVTGLDSTTASGIQEQAFFAGENNEYVVVSARKQNIAIKYSIIALGI